MRAATPLSNSPSSFDALMNRLDTAVTRPRMGSGVTIWIRLWRTKTDTESAAPNAARASIEIHSQLDSAKMTVATP
jgi:hypothetical protein